MPRLVSAETLSAQDKRALWEGLKSLQPATSDLLRQDERLIEAKRFFKAELVFEQTHYRALHMAGLQAIEEKRHASSKK